MKHILFTTIFFISASILLAGQPNDVTAKVDYAEETAPIREKIGSWASKAKNPLKLLPVDSARAQFAIFQLGIPLHSTLAAFIYHCGGMTVDHGWIRVIGSGNTGFERGFLDWNKDRKAYRPDSTELILIADDVVGGLFGLEKRSDGDIENSLVYYYGPNSLRWETVGLSYAGFIRYCMNGDLNQFYGDFKWKGWREEISVINTNQVISCYPLLWTKEGKELKVNRKVTAINSLWNQYFPKPKKTTITKKPAPAKVVKK